MKKHHTDWEKDFASYLFDILGCYLRYTKNSENYTKEKIIQSMGSWMEFENGMESERPWKMKCKCPINMENIQAH